MVFLGYIEVINLNYSLISTHTFTKTTFYMFCYSLVYIEVLNLLILKHFFTVLNLHYFLSSLIINQGNITIYTMGPLVYA